MRAYRSFGFVLTMAAAFLVADGPAQAACTFSFNWYCGGVKDCARTMGRSTGTVQGFGSEQACESARSNWRGKGFGTGSCDRSGICDAPAAAPSGAPRGGQSGGFTGGGTPMPTYDDEADRLAREQAEAAERAAKQKAEQEARLKAEQEKKFQQGKQEALGSLKGTGTQDGLELKTPSASGGSPELKTAIEAPRLKQPSPPARENAAADAEAIAKRAARLEPPPPWPLEELALNHGELLENALTGVEGYRQYREMAGVTLKFPKLNIGLEAILFTGKMLLAGEKGLRVYVLRQGELTEKAAGYFKPDADPKERAEFMEVVRAIREKRPVDQRSEPRRTMFAAAQAMLDPRNSESYTWKNIAMDLVATPEAKKAMINYAMVEVTGRALGSAAGHLAKRGASAIDNRELASIIRTSSGTGDSTPKNLPLDAEAVRSALSTVTEFKRSRDETVKDALEILRKGDKYLRLASEGAPTQGEKNVIKAMIHAEAILVKAYAAEKAAMTEAFTNWSAGKIAEDYLKERKAMATP